MRSPLCCLTSDTHSLSVLLLGHVTIPFSREQHNVSIVLEYPSRSNLNCLIVVLRGLGRKGDESRFHSGLSTSVEWGKPLSIFYHFKEHFLFSQGVWVTNLPTPTPPSFVLQSYKTFSIPTSPFLIFSSLPSLDVFYFRVCHCFTTEFGIFVVPVGFEPTTTCM
jgi:hypothetical protein